MAEEVKVPKDRDVLLRVALIGSAVFAIVVYFASQHPQTPPTELKTEQATAEPKLVPKPEAKPEQKSEPKSQVSGFGLWEANAEQKARFQRMIAAYGYNCPGVYSAMTSARPGVREDEYGKQFVVICENNQQYLVSISQDQVVVRPRR